MEPWVAFRRWPGHDNAIAALIDALQRARLPVRVQLLEDPWRALPPGPGILAYSFSTLELKAVIDDLSRVRRLPGAAVLLVAGGPHSSADPQGALAMGFDAVCVGEGEQSFPHLVRQWLDGGSQAVARRPIRFPPQGLFSLDEGCHAAPSHRLFPFIEIARGCPYGCSFCQVGGLFGRRMQWRSPASVARGVALVVAAGFRRVRFLTSDAFAYRCDELDGREALECLLQACRGAGASQLMLGTFPSEVRPDRVEPDRLEVLRRLCFNRTVVLGAQSGSDRVLHAMHRGHDVEASRRAVRLVLEAGLRPHVDVLFGFPGETEEDALRTLEFVDWCLRQGPVRFHGHVFLPLPGTPAWPLAPERLSPRVLRRLRQLAAEGRLDGYWSHQIAQGKQILRWRAAGLIRA